MGYLFTLYPFNGLFSRTTCVSRYQKSTRSSAIAEGPRDASCQLKSCQLPRNSAETTYTTSFDQIDGMKLEIWSEAKRDRQCALNHDAIESTSIVSSVINKPMTLSCVYHLSTDDFLWRNFLSPQCRNCSRDPDHAHLGSTHSSQDFTLPTRVRNLKSLALDVAEILHGV